MMWKKEDQVSVEHYFSKTNLISDWKGEIEMELSILHSHVSNCPYSLKDLFLRAWPVDWYFFFSVVTWPSMEIFTSFSIPANRFFLGLQELRQARIYKASEIKLAICDIAIWMKPFLTYLGRTFITDFFLWYITPKRPSWMW